MSTQWIIDRLLCTFSDVFVCENVNPTWNFFDLGITSFELYIFREKASQALNLELNILLFYEFPSIEQLADAIHHSISVG